MTRRKTKNITGISRLSGIPYHEAWVAFICIKCKELNLLRIGSNLLKPTKAYKESSFLPEK